MLEKMRELDFLRALGPKMFPIASESTETYFKNNIMVGVSNCAQTNYVQWELESIAKTSTWEEWQYDHETNRGRAHPVDMLYGFLLLALSPMVKKGASTQKAFENMCNIKLKMQGIPLIDSLSRLTSRDPVVSGMWILIIRRPRPVHARITVPMSRRKDLMPFAQESKEDYTARREEIKKKCSNEIHPTEDQLYFSRNKVLLQGVNPGVICTKCGARGHHHEKTHDDVYAPYFSNEDIHYNPTFPEWMNVIPYPSEEIQLTKLLEKEKGFTLTIRETTTKIPLRLARKLLLDGLDVEGTIHASGVGKRRRILNGALDEERQGKTDKHHDSIQHYESLQLDVSEDRLNYDFFWKNHIRLAREFGFFSEAEYWETLQVKS
jgi:hypothetical protein